MLVLQIPHRSANFVGPDPSFPSPIEVLVTLSPSSLFGEEPLDGTLGVVAGGHEVRLHREKFNGSIIPSSSGRLNQLKLMSSLFEYPVELKGAKAKISCESGTAEDLSDMISLGIIHLPAFLSACVRAAIVATDAGGSVGESEFSVEFLGSRTIPIRCESSDALAQRMDQHLLKVSRLPDGAERIFSAHRYLAQARRLRHVSAHPGEFLGERMLNLYKLLEALFASRQVDEIRKYLSGLSVPYEIREILCSIVYVRDKLDGGHMALHPLAREEYEIVHEFAHNAEDAANWLLLHVVDQAANGSFRVKQSEHSDRSRMIGELAKRREVRVEPYDTNPLHGTTSNEDPRPESTKPNAPCPCGSNRKYKKCCGKPRSAR